MAWSLLLGYAVLIYLISDCPDPERSLRLPTGSIPHLIEFAGFGILTWLVGGLQPWGRRPWRYLVMALVGAGYAASDEWHQSFVPGRSAELIDWGCDVAGVLLAVGGLAWAETRRGWRLRRVPLWPWLAGLLRWPMSRGGR